jgi:hypothetical protein
MCNVCNRKKHPGNDCPFFSWHPYANKDTRTPFPDSSKDKEFTLNHTKHFKYLDDKDLDGVTPYTNRPQDFQLPPTVQAPKDSTSGQPKGGKSKGTDSDLVAFSFHKPTFLNAVHMHSLDNLVNCTISLSQVVGQKRSIGHKDLEV